MAGRTSNCLRLTEPKPQERNTFQAPSGTLAEQQSGSHKYYRHCLPGSQPTPQGPGGSRTQRGRRRQTPDNPLFPKHQLATARRRAKRRIAIHISHSAVNGYHTRSARWTLPTRDLPHRLLRYKIRQHIMLASFNIRGRRPKQTRLEFERWMKRRNITIAMIQ